MVHCQQCALCSILSITRLHKSLRGWVTDHPFQDGFTFTVDIPLMFNTISQEWVDKLRGRKGRQELSRTIQQFISKQNSRDKFSNLRILLCNGEFVNPGHFFVSFVNSRIYGIDHTLQYTLVFKSETLKFMKDRTFETKILYCLTFIK